MPVGGDLFTPLLLVEAALALLIVLPRLLKSVEYNSTSGVDVVFKARDAVKNDPAELHVTNHRWDFIDVVPAQMLKQVPNNNPVVAVDSLCI